MKAKSTPKINRRVAGLPIRAALEPRPDLGSNPATEIFRAVKEGNQNADTTRKENEKISAAINQATDKRQTEVHRNTSNSRSENKQQQKILESKNTEISSREVERAKGDTEVVPGISFVYSGNEQMRVVSLQPPKPRKFPKKPKEAVRVVTNSRETDKTSQLFERTKAEELYELLHQLTLSAEEPCNSVRVRRSDLMASTNIKTRITLDLNLKRLEENGLIKIESRPGEQEGNIYTVFPLKTNFE